MKVIFIPLVYLFLKPQDVVGSEARNFDLRGDLSTWVKGEVKLSSPRSFLGAASAGDFALFAGGIEANGARSEIVDMYNICDRRIKVNTLSEARSEIGSASFMNGRYAVFAGGKKNDTSFSKRIDIYDSKKRCWVKLDMTSARAAPQLIDLGSILVIYGGATLDIPFISMTVDYLDSDLRLNTIMNDVSGYPFVGISSGNTVLSNGIALGGYTNSNLGGDMILYGPSNQTLFFKRVGKNVVLEALNPVPSPRIGMSGAFSFDRLVYAGGHTIANDGYTLVPSNKISQFNSRRNFHTDLEITLSEPRTYIYSGAFDRFVLFWGGGKSKILEVFDSTNLELLSGIPSKLNLTISRDVAGTTVSKNCIMFVAGGLVWNTGKPTDSIEIISAC
ncbi:F-box/kelch-repeat protein SKIP11 [Smittium mucronatum]|uniref:F-box/kelch-repeat protein SKIP11 n=1 Tax=Smittium mucronatum TaxID=133383 RepID=A0A1R0H8D1_9FUNG|nr:F-box/kelch-repeat protein SKIP11 [Smittium mucronatum]